MEIFIALFGLGVMGAMLVVPIVALVLAIRSRKAANALQHNFFTARFGAEAAAKRIAALEERLQRLESLASGFQSAAREAVPQAQPLEPVPSAPETPHSRSPQVDVPKVHSPQVDAPALDVMAVSSASSDVAGVPDGPVPSRPEEPARIESIAQGSELSAPSADESLADPVTAESPRKSETPNKTIPTATAPSSGDSEENPFNRPPSQFNWESLIGVRLFAWLGGGALFLGAALFLHYSIQQDLISPPVRVALGLMTGALLLAGGDRLRFKAMMASQAIMGAGVGTLYAALYASRSLYHLLPTPAAFAGMALVTVTAGAMSVRRNAYLLAVLGLIGGMATPFLLSTGEDRPWSLFGYVLFLDLGIAWVSKKREWPTLALLGFCTSLLVFIAWCSEYLYSNRVPYALFAIALVAALFASMIRFKRTGASEVDPTVRALAQFAVATPLLVALVLVCHPRMHIDPTFLSAYVALMAFGSTLVAHHLGARYLPVSVAFMGVLTQALRTYGDLFPAHTVATLAGFSILPLTHAGLAWWKRETSFASIHRWALALVLASPLGLATLAGSFRPANAHLALGAYTALHVLGLLYLAFRYAEPKFFVLGQVVAWLVALSLRTTGGAAITGLWSIWLAVSALLFWALPLVVSSLKRQPLALGASALALPLHFALLYVFTRRDWESGPLGLLSVIGGLLMVVGIRRLRALSFEDDRDKTTAMALHGAMCLAFLTAALPILLDKQWLTVAFGLEVAALAWLRKRVAHDGLVLAAALLAVVAFSRLVFNYWLWHYHPRSGIPILNFYLYTFGLVALSFMLASRMIQGNRFSTEFKMGMWLNWAAVVLWFVLVNIEVADVFSTGRVLVFHYSDGGLAQDMAYSLSWGCFALVLMALGIIRRTRGLRLGALLFLSLTVIKVFLHDLWQLGALYRVGSVVGLAVALLAVSFLVQRFILRGDKA